jgi:aldose 1-epimerase
LDFRGARRIGDTFVDHAYTRIGFAEGGSTTARVLAADGSGTAVTWDRSCPWVQVHTGDRPEPELNRTGLALEPMTCPPDAFRTGTDVIVLQPGEEHAVTFRFSRIEA